MVNSGTEATMSCIRLARGFTGRNKIIKFDGCYHGHVDALLVNRGAVKSRRKALDVDKFVLLLGLCGAGSKP